MTKCDADPFRPRRPRVLRSRDVELAVASDSRPALSRYRPLFVERWQQGGQLAWGSCQGAVLPVSGATDPKTACACFSTGHLGDRQPVAVLRDRRDADDGDGHVFIVGDWHHLPDGLHPAADAGLVDRHAHRRLPRRILALLHAQGRRWGPSASERLHDRPGVHTPAASAARCSAPVVGGRVTATTTDLALTTTVHARQCTRLSALARNSPRRLAAWLTCHSSTHDRALDNPPGTAPAVDPTRPNAPRSASLLPSCP